MKIEVPESWRRISMSECVCVVHDSFSLHGAARVRDQKHTFTHTQTQYISFDIFFNLFMETKQIRFMIYNH